MYVHVPYEGQDQKLTSSIFYHSSPCFWGKSLSLDLELTSVDRLDDQQTPRLWVSALLQRRGYRRGCLQLGTQLSHGYEESEFRPSGLYSLSLTNWAVFTVFDLFFNGWTDSISAYLSFYTNTMLVPDSVWVYTLEWSRKRGIARAQKSSETFGR